MKESHIYSIWSEYLTGRNDLISIEGKSIKVIQPGRLNSNSGPDFSYAEVQIDGIRWKGNVEIHCKTSDWLKHGHSQDAAYSNLILHVVFEHDIDIPFSFPTLELRNFISESFILDGMNSSEIQNDSFNFKTDHLSEKAIRKLAIMRLERKSEIILEDLKATKNDWQEVFYRILARNMGFKVNSQPFEWLAYSTPLSILRRHSDNLNSIESILFGQSGMLTETHESTESTEYLFKLGHEYQRYKWKYRLSSINPVSWKFMRMRPLNFPSLRLAQFAAILYKYPNIGSKVLIAESCDSITKYFNVKASDFWNSHYSFFCKSTSKEKFLGSNSINNILINSVVPFRYVYNKTHGLNNFSQESLSWLSQLPFEPNHKTLKMSYFNENSKSALESQAIMEHYFINNA